MTPWRARAAQYLALRRALGHRLVEVERLLDQFLDYLEQVGASMITVEQALAWSRLPAGGSPAWHATRLSAVRGFAAWLHTFDPEVQVPPRGLLPLRTTRATPYLYSPQQVAALMAAAGDLSPAEWARTMQTLIGLLWVTGMRIGEALSATVADLDLRAATLTVVRAKFGKDRRLTLHPSTVQALDRYLRSRSPVASTAPLLVTPKGNRLAYTSVHDRFVTLVDQVGLDSRSPSCRPRFHDFRHSFAVHTMLDAYHHDGDPTARLRHLSTWLGHTEPANTYWYLHAAPELMTLAADRLQSHWAEVRTP